MNISEINEKIRSHNPFRANVDRTSTIWGVSFPDVPQHNAKVFELVQKGLWIVSNPSESRVQTLTILGNVGRGKTQLFSRIKHRLFDENQILFSYIDARNLKSDRLLYTWMRQSLINDLSRCRGESGISQIEEIAHFLFNTSIPEVFSSPAGLKKRFDQARQNHQERGKDLVNSLLSKVSDQFPRVDGHIIRALLWSVSKEYGSMALKWLSGRSLDPDTAMKLGLTTNLPDSEDNHDNLAEIRESESSDFLRNFIPTIAQYKTLVIGFDELENADFIHSAGGTNTKAFTVLGFIKDLFDSFEGISNALNTDVIAIPTMIDSTWSDYAQQARGSGGSGQIDRITTLSPEARTPVFLERLTPDTGVEMIQLWLKERLYEKLGVNPPSTFHPFTEEEICELAEFRSTPRELLNQCAELFDKKLDSNDEETFKQALIETQQRKFDPASLNDSDYVGDILRFGFELLDSLEEPINTTTTTNGEQIQQLFIDGVTDEIAIVKPSAEPKGLQPDNYIEFKITGRTASQTFSIGVGVNQTKSYPQIHAELRRLNAKERFGFTRSCFVRGAGLPLGGKVTNALRHQLESQGGEVVRFTPEDIYPLWCLYQLKEQNLGFSENSLESLIMKFESNMVCTNPVLLEILSSTPTEPEPVSEEKSEDDDDEDLFKAFRTGENGDDDNDTDDDDEDLFSAFRR
jgi:hypothetical protein